MDISAVEPSRDKKGNDLRRNTQIRKSVYFEATEKGVIKIKAHLF